jgi:protease I
MKIACILGEGFEDSELRVPYDRLRASGHTVDIVGAKAGDVLSGKKGKERIPVDRSIEGVSADEYDALLIPGGNSPDHLRADRRFVELVKRFDADEKPIFAICHGPQILISAGLVKGRTMTAWKTIQDDLRAAGANVIDRDVVVAGNLITSRQPSDLDAFCREALGALGQGVQPGA